jgi:hypothetical protein
MSVSPDPRVVLQTYLDDLALAALTDDWETYRQGVDLPCAVISHTTTKLVATETELRHGYDELVAALRIQKVTHFIRLVEQAAALDHDLISGSYITHLISGGHRILAPYQSLICLRQVEGRWRAASITNGLANSRWTLMRPNTEEEL